MATRTWTGNVSNAWDNAANWLEGVVPGAGDLIAFARLTDLASLTAKVDALPGQVWSKLAIESFHVPGSSSVFYEPIADRLYVGTTAANVLNVINAADHSLIQQVAFSARPYDFHFVPSLKHLYCMTVSGLLQVLDTETLQVVGSITPPPAGITWWLAVNPITRRLYISQKTAGATHVYNCDDNSLITSIAMGDPLIPWMEPSTNRLYVPNSGPGTLTIIDTTTNTVLNTIAGIGNGPGTVAVNARTNTLYVACYYSNEVVVMNLANNAITARIPVAATPRYCRFSPRLNLLAVIHENGLTLIDTRTNTVMSSVQGFPWRVGSFNEKTGQLYLTENPTNSVHVVSMHDSLAASGRSITVQAPDVTVDTAPFAQALEDGLTPIASQITVISQTVARLVGLAQENAVTEPVFDNATRLLASATVYIYDSAAHATAHDKATGLLYTYAVDNTYSGGVLQNSTTTRLS